jgi:hypothetical protein
MKIKEDFITNSSSTSFILSIKGELDKNNFMDKIGVTGDFPLSQLFNDFFDSIQYNKKEISEYMKDCKEDNKTVEEFLESEGYDEDVIFKVKELINSDRDVYYGKISSDGSSTAEVFFCMESFLICEDDIYFNGEISGW